MYHLDQLAARPDEHVFLCEGEKTAEALTACGLLSTTNVIGSGNWEPHYAECVRGRNVVMMPDADSKGEAFRDAVLSSLRGVAAQVQVVEMPAEFVKAHPEFTGHDFADYAQVHGDAKAFEDLMTWTDAAEVMPKGISAKILGRPADGFKELQRRARLGIRNDVFNMGLWLPSLGQVDVNRGDLIVLMANTSVGKTRLIHNLPFYLRHVNFALFYL